MLACACLCVLKAALFEGGAQFGDTEGASKKLLGSDPEATRWFADEWGNPPGGVNVSFLTDRPKVPRTGGKRGRIAILQSGSYATWFWKPTLDMIVHPAASDGWEVDYFGYFQRGSVDRYDEDEEDPEAAHQSGIQRNIDWNVSVGMFVKDLREAGGHLRSLRASKDTRDVFIGRRFVLEKVHPVGTYTHARCSDPECPGCTQDKTCGEPCDPKTQQCDPPHTGEPQTEGQAWWNVLQVTNAFTAHAITSREEEPYTWVLRVREDAGWYAPLNISLARVGVSYFRPCMNYGGISDKAYLTSPEHAVLIAQDMHAARYTQLNHQYQENSEQLLWEVVNYNSIPYAPIIPDDQRPENAKFFREAGPTRIHRDIPQTEGRASFDADTGRMVSFGLTVADARTYNSETGAWCFKRKYFEFEGGVKDGQGACGETPVTFVPPGGARMCDQVKESMNVAFKGGKNITRWEFAYLKP